VEKAETIQQQIQIECGTTREITTTGIQALVKSFMKERENTNTYYKDTMEGLWDIFNKIQKQTRLK
jgi:hypothetical protein